MILFLNKTFVARSKDINKIIGREWTNPMPQNPWLFTQESPLYFQRQPKKGPYILSPYLKLYWLTIKLSKSKYILQSFLDWLNLEKNSNDSNNSFSKMPIFINVFFWAFIHGGYLWSIQIVHTMKFFIGIDSHHKDRKLRGNFSCLPRFSYIQSAPPS